MAKPLTDNQVRAIKGCLIRGAHPTALAIAYGVGAETIRRIKRGETHNRVKVLGEEVLREDYGQIDAVRPEGMSLGLPKLTQEEVAASEARVMAMLARPKNEGDVLLAEMVKADPGEEELMAKARMLGM